MREKLIELLRKATIEVDEGYPMSEYKCRAVSDEVAACLADHLLANGVTVQEWIPVSERLPECRESVLMHFKSGLNMVAGFLLDVDEDRAMWCAYMDAGYYTDCDYEPSHWMPVPLPPKGE